MTHDDFIDTTSYAERLSEANEAEARRLEPRALAGAVSVLAIIGYGAWRLASWVLS